MRVVSIFSCNSWQVEVVHWHWDYIGYRGFAPKQRSRKLWMPETSAPGQIIVVPDQQSCSSHQMLLYQGHFVVKVSLVAPLQCLLHNLKSEKQSARCCVLVPVIGRSSLVVHHTCWWPAVLYGNGVSGTQSPLCSSSTLACCDCG